MSPRKSDQDEWLAEAARALADAERLADLLALHGPRDELTLAVIQAEILGLRREVERLQRDRAGERRREFHPDWSKFSVWTLVP